MTLSEDEPTRRLERACTAPVGDKIDAQDFILLHPFGLIVVTHSITPEDETRLLLY